MMDSYYSVPQGRDDSVVESKTSNPPSPCTVPNIQKLIQQNILEAMEKFMEKNGDKLGRGVRDKMSQMEKKMTMLITRLKNIKLALKGKKSKLSQQKGEKLSDEKDKETYASSI